MKSCWKPWFFHSLAKNLVSILLLGLLPEGIQHELDSRHVEQDPHWFYRGSRILKNVAKTIHIVSKFIIFITISHTIIASKIENLKIKYSESLHQKLKIPKTKKSKISIFEIKKSKIENFKNQKLEIIILKFFIEIKILF